jgi:hypothetical protein
MNIEAVKEKHEERLMRLPNVTTNISAGGDPVRW